MGHKYEVGEWYNDITDGAGHRYSQDYVGRSLFIAMFTMIKLKLNGSSCIRLVVR